jgi:hypothetical protein
LNEPSTLTNFLQGIREEFNIDPDKAKEDAQALFDAGKLQFTSY